MNIEENNKLIAEFMAIPKCDRCDDCGNYKFGSGIYLSPKEMDYHHSYDALIPVMQRIYMTATSMPKEYSDVTHAFAINPIEDNYKIVVAFINWYNENK